MIPLSHVLLLSGILFSLAVAGIFINRKNVLLLLMCIEWRPPSRPSAWPSWSCCSANGAASTSKTSMR